MRAPGGGVYWTFVHHSNGGERRTPFGRGTRIVFDRRDQGRLGMSDYQIVRLDEVDDWLGDYPGEMRGITYAIGAEQAALTHRRMPQHTGSKGSYGHRHKTQEEIYYVISGRLQFKLGDEIHEETAARQFACHLRRSVRSGTTDPPTRSS
jgi:mannose-6-phosphate isomerase-like protein (cupin superfamily)